MDVVMDAVMIARKHVKLTAQLHADPLAQGVAVPTVMRSVQLNVQPYVQDVRHHALGNVHHVAQYVLVTVMDVRANAQEYVKVVAEQDVPADAAIHVPKGV